MKSQLDVLRTLRPGRSMRSAKALLRSLVESIIAGEDSLEICHVIPSHSDAALSREVRS